MKKNLVFLLTLAALAGEAQTNINRVEGQIYITKKDRETVKMSLVTVRIVDSK